MKNYYIPFFLVFLYSAFSSCNGASSQTENPERFIINLTPQMEFYVDKTRSLEISDVTAESLRDRFVKNQSQSTPYWIKNVEIWGKVLLSENLPNEKLYLFLHHPTIQHLDFYFPDGSQFQKIENGHTLSPRKRPYPGRKIVTPFPKDSSKYQGETIYFKAYSPDIEFNLNLTLTNSNGLIHLITQDTALQFIFIGIILVMVIYNFFLYWSIRDKIYLLYCAHVSVFGMMLFGANGLLQEYFISDFSTTVWITSYLAILSLMLTNKFAQKFLYLKKNLPHHYFLLQIIFYSAPCIMLLFPINATIYNIIFYSLVFCSQIIVLLSGLSLYRKYSFARDFTRAWVVLLISISIYSMAIVGIHISSISLYSLQTGAALESVLLAFALGRRVRHLESQKHLYGEVKKDLAFAEKIQKQLLPQAPPASRRYTIAWRYLPSTMLSGDFYDYKIEKGVVSLIMADVAGHGYAASLIASMVKIVFHETFNLHKSTKATVKEINRILCEHIHMVYTTTLYLRIIPEKKEFHLVRSGHLPLLHYNKKQGKLHTYMPPGSPLGVSKKYKCKELIISYQAGDRLLLFTDGLIEEPNPSGEEYGLKRLTNEFVQNQNKPPEDFCDHLKVQIQKWSINSFRDDVSFLIVELN